MLECVGPFVLTWGYLYQVQQRSQVDSTDSKACTLGKSSTFFFLDIRQRLGKRPHSPEKACNPIVRREPFSDVHSRLGVPRQDIKGLYSDTREKKSGSLWTRLGSASKTKEKNMKKVDHRAPGTEEDDSELQRAWGALIKEKEQSRQKKSRLDNLPSLQIEVSRESSSGSEAES